MGDSFSLAWRVPDDWTALSGAADSPRYRALGNSVAIPCVEFLMRGMALALLAG